MSRLQNWLFVFLILAGCSGGEGGGNKAPENLSGIVKDPTQGVPDGSIVDAIEDGNASRTADVTYHIAIKDLLGNQVTAPQGWLLAESLLQCESFQGTIQGLSGTVKTTAKQLPHCRLLSSEINIGGMIYLAKLNKRDVLEFTIGGVQRRLFWVATKVGANGASVSLNYVADTISLPGSMSNAVGDKTFSDMPRFIPLAALGKLSGQYLCLQCPTHITNAFLYDAITDRPNARLTQPLEGLPQEKTAGGIRLESIPVQLSLQLRERLIYNWSSYLHLEVLVASGELIRFSHKLAVDLAVLQSLQQVGADQLFAKPEATAQSGDGGANLGGIDSLEQILVDRVVSSDSPVGISLTSIEFPNRNTVQITLAGGENWIIEGDVRATLELGDTTAVVTLPNSMVATVFRRNICSETKELLQIWQSYCGACHQLNFTSNESKAAMLLAGTMPPAGTPQRLALEASLPEQNYLKSYLTSDCSNGSAQSLTFEAPADLLHQINEQLKGEAKSVDLTFKVADAKVTSTSIVRVDIPEALGPAPTPTPTPAPAATATPAPTATPDPNATPTPAPTPTPTPDLNATPGPTPTPTPGPNATPTPAPGPEPAGPASMSSLSMTDNGSTQTSSLGITVASAVFGQSTLTLSITGMTGEVPGLLSGLFEATYQIDLQATGDSSAILSPNLSLIAAQCDPAEAQSILGNTCKTCHAGVDGDPKSPTWDKIHQRAWVLKNMPPNAATLSDANRFAIGMTAKRIGVDQDCNGSEVNTMTVAIPESLRQIISDNLTASQQPFSVKLAFSNGESQTFNWVIAKEDAPVPTPTPAPGATPTPTPLPTATPDPNATLTPTPIPTPTPAPTLEHLPELEPRAQLDLSLLKTIQFRMKTMNGESVSQENLDVAPEMGEILCRVEGQQVIVADFDDTARTDEQLRRTEFSIDSRSGLTGKADECHVTVTKWRNLGSSPQTSTDKTLSGWGQTAVVVQKSTLFDPSSPLARNKMAFDGISEVTLMRGIWNPAVDQDDLPIRVGVFLTDMFGNMYGGSNLPRFLPRSIELHCAGGQVGTAKNLLIPDAIHGLTNGYWLFFADEQEGLLRDCQFRFISYYSLFKGRSGSIAGSFDSGTFVTSADGDSLFVAQQIGDVRANGNYVTKVARIATGIVWGRFKGVVRQSQSREFETAPGMLFDLATLRSTKDQFGQDYLMLGLDNCYGCGNANTKLHDLKLKFAFNTGEVDRDALLSQIADTVPFEKTLVLAESLRGERNFKPAQPSFTQNCSQCHIFPRSFLETEEMLRLNGMAKLTPQTGSHKDLSLSSQDKTWIELWSLANLNANNQYAEDTFLLKLTETQKSDIVNAVNQRRQQSDVQQAVGFELALLAGFDGDDGWVLTRFEANLIKAVLSVNTTGNPSLNPTPTPGPTPTPDPNATPTPGPSPTATPDPNATPTPNPSASPVSVGEESLKDFIADTYMPIGIPTFEDDDVTGPGERDKDLVYLEQGFKGNPGPVLNWPVARIPLELREPLCSHLSPVPCQSCDADTVDRCVRDLVYYTNAQRSPLTVTDFFGSPTSNGLITEFTATSEIARLIVDNVRCFHDRQIKAEAMLQNPGIPTERAAIVAQTPVVPYQYMAPFFADEVDNNYNELTLLIGCHEYQGEASDYMSHTVGKILGDYAAQPGCHETYYDQTTRQYITRLKTNIQPYALKTMDLNTYLNSQVTSTCANQLKQLDSVSGQLAQVQNGSLQELEYIRNYAAQCYDRFTKNQKTFNQENGFLVVRSLAGKDQKNTSLFSIKDSRVATNSQTRWLLYCPEATAGGIGVSYHAGDDLGDLHAIKTSHVKMKEATLDIKQGTYSYAHLHFVNSTLDFKSFTVLQTGELILDKTTVLVDKTALVNAGKIILRNGSKMIVRSPLKANTEVELHDGSFLEINAGASIKSLLVRRGSVVAVAPFSGTWDEAKQSWTLTTGEPSFGSGRLQITADTIELDETSRITADGAGFCGNSSNGFDHQGPTYDGKGAGRVNHSKRAEQISAYGTSEPGGPQRYGRDDFASKLYLGAGYTSTNCGGGALKLKAREMKIGGTVSSKPMMLRNADKSCWENVTGANCMNSAGTGGTIVFEADDLYLYSGSHLDFARSGAVPPNAITTTYGQGRLAITATKNFVSLGRMTRAPDTTNILQSLLASSTSNLIHMHLSSTVDSPSYLETESERFHFGAVDMTANSDFSLQAALQAAGIERIPLLTIGLGRVTIDVPLEVGELVVQSGGDLTLFGALSATDITVDQGGTLRVAADFSKEPYISVNGTLELHSSISVKALEVAHSGIGGLVTTRAFPRDQSLWDGSAYTPASQSFGRIVVVASESIVVGKTGAISADGKGFPYALKGWSYKGPDSSVGSTMSDRCPASYGTFGRSASNQVGTLPACSFDASELFQETPDLRKSLTLGTGGSYHFNQSVQAEIPTLAGGGAIYLKTKSLVNHGSISANGGLREESISGRPSRSPGTGGTVVIEAKTAHLGRLAARGGLIRTESNSAVNLYRGGHGRIQLFVTKVETDDNGSYGEIVPLPQGGFASEIQNQSTIFEFEADGWGAGYIRTAEGRLDSVEWPFKEAEYTSLAWPFGRVYQIKRMVLRDGAVAPFNNPRFGSRIEALEIDNTAQVFPESIGIGKAECISGALTFAKGVIIPDLQLPGPCSVSFSGETVLGEVLLDHSGARFIWDSDQKDLFAINAQKGEVVLNKLAKFKSLTIGGDSPSQAATLTGRGFDRTRSDIVGVGNGVLDLAVEGELRIGRYGSVNMNGKGYRGGQNIHPNCTQGESQAGAGISSIAPNGPAGGCQGSASHITLGKSEFAVRDGTYNHSPGQWVLGAGAGGHSNEGLNRGDGGGVVNIKAAKVVLDGSVTAQGTSVGTRLLGFGAGGSVVIDTKDFEAGAQASVLVDTPVRYFNSFELFGGAGRFSLCHGSELTRVALHPNAVMKPGPMEFNLCLPHMGDGWQLEQVVSNGDFRSVVFKGSSDNKVTSHAIQTNRDSELSTLKKLYTDLGLEVGRMEISGTEPWSLGTTDPVTISNLVVSAPLVVAEGETLNVDTIVINSSGQLEVKGALRVAGSFTISDQGGSARLMTALQGLPDFTVGTGGTVFLGTQLDVKTFNNRGTITSGQFDRTATFANESWSNPPAAGLGILKIAATTFTNAGTLTMADAGIGATQTGDFSDPSSQLGAEFPSDLFEFILGGGKGKVGGGSIAISANQINLTGQSSLQASSANDAGGTIALHAAGHISIGGVLNAGTTGAVFFHGAEVSGVANITSPVHEQLPAKTFVKDGQCAGLRVKNNQLSVTSTTANEMSFGLFSEKMVERILADCDGFETLEVEAATIGISSPISVGNIRLSNGAMVSALAINNVNRIGLEGALDYNQRNSQTSKLRIGRVTFKEGAEKIDIMDGHLFLDQIAGGAVGLVESKVGYNNKGSHLYVGQGTLRAGNVYIDRYSSLKFHTSEFFYNPMTAAWVAQTPGDHSEPSLAANLLEVRQYGVVETVCLGGQTLRLAMKLSAQRIKNGGNISVASCSGSIPRLYVDSDNDIESDTNNYTGSVNVTAGGEIFYLKPVNLDSPANYSVPPQLIAPEQTTVVKAAMTANNATEAGRLNSTFTFLEAFAESKSLYQVTTDYLQVGEAVFTVEGATLNASQQMAITLAENATMLVLADSGGVAEAKPSNIVWQGHIFDFDAVNSCDAVKAGGASTDGIYVIDPDGRGPAPSLNLYCHNMAGTPSVYLPLARNPDTGFPTANLGVYEAKDRCAYCDNVSFYYTQVRFTDLAKLELDTSDRTFMNVQGNVSCHQNYFNQCKGSTAVYQYYGTASSSNRNVQGTFQIDLTDTGFKLHPFSGWQVVGSVYVYDQPWRAVVEPSGLKASIYGGGYYFQYTRASGNRIRLLPAGGEQ